MRIVTYESGGCLASPFKFADNLAQFVDKRRPACLDEDIEHRSVVPQRPFFAGHKPLPDFLAQVAVVAEDAARVVEFVGGDDEPDRRERFPELRDVDPLSLFPRRLRNDFGVRTAFDNRGHAPAETAENFFPRLRAALVLNGISESGTTRSRPKSQAPHTARFDSGLLFTQSRVITQLVGARHVLKGFVAISAASKRTRCGNHKLSCGYQSIRLLPCWQVRQFLRQNHRP